MTRKKIAERRDLVLEHYARHVSSLAEMREWLRTKGIEVTRHTVMRDYWFLGLASGKPAGRPPRQRKAVA